MTNSILIAGGTGFIGTALTQHLLAHDYAVSIVGRSKVKITKQLGTDVTAYSWDELSEKIITDFGAIINLTGANIADKRWSAKRKAEILSSRVEATETIAKLCAGLGTQAPRLYNASAVGIYGLDKASESVAKDEDSLINTQKFSDYLNEVGVRWEQATDAAKQAGVNVVNLRFGVVMGKNGGMLKKLLPIFKLGLGQIIGSGQQKLAWVSLSDVIGAIDFLLQHTEINGPINIVAPTMMTQTQFAKQLAQHLQRPCYLKLPASVVRLLFGQMGNELLLGGQSVYPKKLLSAGYSFKAARFNDFLRQQLR